MKLELNISIRHKGRIMSRILTYVRVALTTSDVHKKYRQLMRSTWRIETMVLPELSRTMAYTTRNTANRLARAQLHLNHVVSERTKRGMNLCIELEKHKFDH